MSANKGLEWTFDAVASTYEKLRPGYCDELYKTIFDYVNINHSSKVVEVGIGGGQGTLPFLKTGCSLTAIEIGENFSNLCKEKFREYPKFNIITSRFEDVEFDKGAYDLVYSASAFHWVSEQVGYSKVFSMLRSGGVFARFANHPFRDKGKPSLCMEMDDIYAQYYYSYYNTTPKMPIEYTEEDAKECALIAEKYGFRDIRYALFHRVRTFTASEYSMLLSTYSDHNAMDENIRKKFFAKIEEAIERHGGAITLYDTIDLQLARKL